MIENVELTGYTNIKTGNPYTVKGFAINATNKDDGQVMVIYTRSDVENSDLYVREIEEFKQKFTC
jgi:hypothetical protein